MPILSLSVAVATAALDTGGLLAAPTRGPSTRPPSRAYAAAGAGPRRSRWLEPAGAVADVNSHGAGRSGRSRKTRPVAGPAPLRLCIGGDASTDRRPRLPESEVEAFHACRVDRPAPGCQPLLHDLKRSEALR